MNNGKLIPQTLERYPFFKNSQASQEFKKIRDQILTGKQADFSLRLQKTETIKVFSGLSKAEQFNYLTLLEQQLKMISNVYIAAGKSLDEKLKVILEANDISKKSYMQQVISLGGDQILYVNTVVDGLIARSDLSQLFLSLNDEYIAEYSATIDLIQK